MKKYTNFKLIIHRTDKDPMVDAVDNIYWKGCIFIILTSFLLSIILGCRGLSGFPICILFILGLPLWIVVAFIFKEYVILFSLFWLLINTPVLFIITIYSFKYILKII